ncbi:DUF2169 family type VI secretion system accessory protein [Sorangium sp. So ce854]|uniref:DUF2169 family type VI secretion system accessory protein n=1 Tax=Sorangium sp. So ce854 TaxID=3133322 RepID=UPI003F5F7AC0
MEIVSLGRLPAGSLLWQPRPDAWMFTFACKATFTLRPGQSPLAPEQEPFLLVDRHWSDDPARSLFAPTDLVPIRPRADVVLVGEAYAPSGQPVRSLVARLVVVDIDKAVEVHGARWFTQDGVLQEGSPFSRMPLLWERAAGGPDTPNPRGISAEERDARGRRALPNLQPPGMLVAYPEDSIEPIGFGPIAPAWPTRRQRLGRYAPTWSDRDWIHQPLPPDLDATYFNVAPRDQQTQQIRADERLALDNLHPEHPHLVTSLSGHLPRAFVQRPGGLPQPVAVRADLLWIDTARGLCTLTWRGQIPLEHPQEEGRVLVALEEPGQPLSWSELERLAAAPRSSGEVLSLADDARRPLDPTATIAAEILDEAAEEEAATSTLLGPLNQPERPILPFGSPSPAPPASAAPAQRLEGTPFAPAAPPAVAPPPMAPSRLVDVAPPSLAAPLPWSADMGPPPPSVAPPRLVDMAPPALAAPPPWLADMAPPPPSVAPPRLVDMAPPPPPPPVAPLQVRPAAPRTFGEAAMEAAASSLGAAAAPPAVLGASSAAAVADAPWTPPRDLPAPGPVSAPAVRPGVQPTDEARERIELIWFDPDSLPRFRRQPPWRALIKQLEGKRLDKELDDAVLSDDPMQIEDRREVFEILAHASATDAGGLGEALEAAERDDGKFVPPLRLLAGDLLFPFAEIETLKTTVAVATLFQGNDDGLKGAVASAQEMLKLPELQSVPAAAEGLTARIREAWTQGKRPVPHAYLDTQTERALLEQRSYQRRKIFGGKHVRALLQPAGSQELVPAYLPEDLADALPMYARFKARLIAELQVQADQHESHPAALRVLALARATPSLRRR